MDSGGYKDMIEPVKIPGCIPIQGSDLLTIVQDRASDVYKAFMHQVKQFNIAEGILLNSFDELEKRAIQALQEKNTIYPIGPRIQTTESTNGSDRSECLKWLDEKPIGSVIFISLGSGGTLYSNQLTDYSGWKRAVKDSFGLSLRMTRQQMPIFFGNSSKEDPLSHLPSGFLDRTKEKLKIAADDEVLKEDGSSSVSLPEFALKLNKSKSG